MSWVGKLDIHLLFFLPSLSRDPWESWPLVPQLRAATWSHWYYLPTHPSLGVCDSCPMALGALPHWSPFRLSGTPPSV